MNPRATVVLLVFAAALGAFVWFYEIEGEAGRQAAAEAEKRLFTDVEPEDVQWVELTTSDGVHVRAERTDGRWDLVVPLLFPGDTAAWDGIAAALTATTSEAVFEDPQPSAVYGLGEGAAQVRFGSADAEFALRLGAEAPLGGNTYAAVVGEPQVHTIATWRASALRKELTALRNKRVLEFDAGSVASFEAEWPGGRVALERNGDGWRMRAPVEDRADAKAVRDLLSDLAFLRADGFEDVPHSDADAGFEPPAFRIALKLEAQEAGAEAAPRTLELSVGSRVSDGTRLARGSQVSLYRIAEARLEDFPREVSAYRYKQLADFSDEAALRVEMAFRSGAGAPVEIVATRGEAGWSSAPEAMDPNKIDALVRALSGLTADTILAEEVGEKELSGLGLAPPAATFTVLGVDADVPLARVRLGALQGGDGLIAQTGERAQVFRLPAGLTEQLPISLEAFRNHFLASETPDEPEPADAAPQADDDAELGFEIDSQALDELLGGQRTAP